jgi:hypothetical protein
LKRALPILPLLLAAACSGADPVPAPPDSSVPTTPVEQSCKTDDDCDPGDFCVFAQCIGDSATAPDDAGEVAVDDAGAPEDAGPDAGTPDAGQDAGPVQLGHLTLSPRAATAQTTAGVQLGAQTFTIGNDGAASLAYSIHCTQGSVSPSSGTLAAGASLSIQVTPPLWNSPGTQSIVCSVNEDTWTLTATVSPVATAIGPSGGSVDLLDFVFTGDTRPANCWTPANDASNPYPDGAFQQIVAKMGALHPQFALDLGDHMFECNENLADATTMMNRYTAAIANAHFGPMWFMTMGNHECGAGSNSDCSGNGTVTDANTRAYLAALQTLSQQTQPFYKLDIQTRFGLARFVFIADNWYPASAQSQIQAGSATPTRTRSTPSW